VIINAVNFCGYKTREKKAEMMKGTTRKKPKKPQENAKAPKLQGERRW
jgi:hypothetical protein